MLISFLTFYGSILTFFLRLRIIYLYFREISYLIQTFLLQIFFNPDIFIRKKGRDADEDRTGIHP